MQTNQPICVCLEGLSGIGKSTIEELLAAALNAERVSTVPREFRSIRRLMDQKPEAVIDARFCLFLSAMLYSQRAIEAQLELGKNVVIESFVYRTIAFHRGMGSTMDVLLPQRMLVPSIIFYLVCDEDVRKKRRADRVKRETAWDRRAEENASAILSEYTRFNMVPIETTRRSPHDIVASMMAIIKERYAHTERVAGDEDVFSPAAVPA